MFAFLGALVGWIVDGFKIAESAIVAFLVGAYNVLKVFAGAIWDGAKFFYTDILKPIGVWLDKAYDRLKTFYEKVIAPVQKWLQRITTQLRKIYNTYVQPVLSTIDGLRKTLELLKLLHVQWAAQLDAELAALEAKIAKPLLWAIQVINTIDSTISKYILTVDNLFQRVTHLKTIQRDVDAVRNIQWNRALSGFNSRQRTPDTPFPPLAAASDHLATFDAVLLDDGSGSGLNIADAEAAFDAMFSDEATQAAA